MIKKHDRLFAGGLFICLGLLILTQVPSIRITTIASDARLMPLIVAALFFLFGVPLLIQGLRAYKKNSKITSTMDKAATIRIVLCMVYFAVFAFLLPRVGFMISGALYLFFTILLLAPKEERKYPLFILVSIIVPVVIYYLFVKGFRLLLPAGSLWR